MRSFTSPHPLSYLSTWGYMAPELVFVPGRNRLCDIRPTRASDVYATATMVACVLTGKKPFSGANDTNVKEAVIAGHPPFDSLAGIGHKKLEQLLQACWNTDVDARADAGELADMLIQAVKDLGGDPDAPGTLPLPQRDEDAVARAASDAKAALPPRADETVIPPDSSPVASTTGSSTATSKPATTTTAGVRFPIHAAARANDTAALNVALDNDPAAVNQKDPTGWAPLHVAASCNNVDIIKALLSWNADVNIVDAKGLTPHGVALAKGSSAAAALLAAEVDKIAQAKKDQLVADDVSHDVEVQARLQREAAAAEVERKFKAQEDERRAAAALAAAEAEANAAIQLAELTAKKRRAEAETQRMMEEAAAEEEKRKAAAAAAAAKAAASAAAAPPKVSRSCYCCGARICLTPSSPASPMPHLGAVASAGGDTAGRHRNVWLLLSAPDAKGERW